MKRIPARQYPEKRLDRNLSSGVGLADLAPWVNNHALAVPSLDEERLRRSVLATTFAGRPSSYSAKAR